MTALRTVSEAESEELWFEGTFREQPASDQLREMWKQYAEEGHLGILAHDGEGDHPGPSWFAKCTCGENAWGLTADEMRAMANAGGTDLARPMPNLINFGQARLWLLDHRLEYGLEKQDFAPTMDLESWTQR